MKTPTCCGIEMKYQLRNDIFICSVCGHVEIAEIDPDEIEPDDDEMERIEKQFDE